MKTPKNRKPVKDPSILPKQPDQDTRSRNAFGILLGFGEAYEDYYDELDKEIVDE